MSNHLKFYINGAWVDPATPRALDVINPATEEPFTRISIGSAADVDRAVAAARAAFPKFSQTSKADRIALLKRIIECYRARMNDIAQAVSAEMGAPIGMALDSQAAAGLAHLDFDLEGARGVRVRGPAQRHARRARGHRRGGIDHAVELAAEPDRLQGGAGASPPAAPWC